MNRQTNSNIAIELKSITKSFQEKPIIENFDMYVGKGTVTALCGPNGSGKSTLLNIIAGVTPIDKGELTKSQEAAEHLSYVFQNYRDSLFPWNTAYDNIGFPLKLRKDDPISIKEKINSLATLFQIQFSLKQYPYQLSGGQLQILSVMRALITHPKLLLIDEVFSALDYENNLLLRTHLLNYFETHKPTIIIVTHSIEEAVHLADTIIVLPKKSGQKTTYIQNTVKRPRDIATLTTDTFHHTKDTVLRAFQEATNICRTYAFAK